MNSEEKQPKSSMDIVTLGERGQVVIPANVREQAGLKAGDRMLVFSKGLMIGLMPADQLRSHVEDLAAKLEAVENSELSETKEA